MIAAAFSGGQKFYIPIICTVAGVLVIFIFLRVFRLVKPKVLYWILTLFFIICALMITGYEMNRGYEKSITMNDQGVDLEEYIPFKDNTKVIKLNEPSTFKIQSELPSIDGATALYPLYSAFVQATYPQKEYKFYNSEVKCSSTSIAYDNLMNEKVDLIFAARPSKEEIEEAKSKGIEFKLTPIGREAFVFFVNAKNPVNVLSTAQIQDIYSGKITNWKDLGGTNQKIKAFQRPENSGSQTILQKFMEGKNLVTPPKEDIATGMGDIIEQTASYRNYDNAIGYSFRYFATEMVKNNRIRLLKVDGIYPDRDNIKNKTYPWVADFYAVTTHSSNLHLKPFIDWILSSQGQYLVEKTGYTPIN
jgi:ABC-type phosphate transport system, periplasmic component